MRWLMFMLLQAMLCTYPCAVFAHSELRRTADHVEPLTGTSQSTPRRTMQRVLQALAGQSEDALRQSFDLQSSAAINDLDIERIIQVFPTLMDQYGQLTPLGLLSDDATGSDEVNLEVDYERVGWIKAARGQAIPILLRRVQTASGEPRWLIAQETLSALAGISRDVTLSKINRVLPQTLLVSYWRGAPVGQWAAVAILALLSAMIAWLVVRPLKRVVERGASRNRTTKITQVLKSLITPLGLGGAVVIFIALERYLEISILIRQDLSILTLTVVWVALFIFIWSLIDNMSSRGEDILRKKNRVGELSIVVFLRASAKVLIVTLAFILVLGSNGIDVTTGLAALGIGGIALALGAQKAIENFIGSIVIVTDQPIRVGDFCRIGEVVGTVERFGLRSTRVRTLDDTVVTFPNGLLASQRIENYTLRRKYLLKGILNLRYETQIHDLKALLNDLRQQLKSIDFIDDEKLRVHFIGYGAASLDVEVFCYIHADDYDHFLERKESVLLDMSALVSQNHSGFAFPSQTLYLSKDSFTKNQEPSAS